MQLSTNRRSRVQGCIRHAKWSRQDSNLQMRNARQFYRLVGLPMPRRLHVLKDQRKKAGWLLPPRPAVLTYVGCNLRAGFTLTRCALGAASIMRAPQDGITFG